MIWAILSGLVGIAVFVLFIMVLIKLFQNEGTGKGILGLICGLYTFVWGWMKHKELDITKVMIAWSVLIVISMILSTLAQSAAQ
jgi:uncharacterized membrane protein YfcA